MKFMLKTICFLFYTASLCPVISQIVVMKSLDEKQTVIFCHDLHASMKKVIPLLKQQFIDQQKKQPGIIVKKIKNLAKKNPNLKIDILLEGTYQNIGIIKKLENKLGNSNKKFSSDVLLQLSKKLKSIEQQHKNITLPPIETRGEVLLGINVITHYYNRHTNIDVLKKNKFSWETLCNFFEKEITYMKTKTQCSNNPNPRLDRICEFFKINQLSIKNDLLKIKKNYNEVLATPWIELVQQKTCYESDIHEALITLNKGSHFGIDYLTTAALDCLDMHIVKTILSNKNKAQVAIVFSGFKHCEKCESYLEGMGYSVSYYKEIQTLDGKKYSSLSECSSYGISLKDITPLNPRLFSLFDPSFDPKELDLCGK